MRTKGVCKGHSKISSCARIVEPQGVSRRESEVDSSEGVGSCLLIYTGRHNRTGHFSEYS